LRLCVPCHALEETSLEEATIMKSEELRLKFKLVGVSKDAAKSSLH
jgi:hypothetical protein